MGHACRHCWTVVERRIPLMSRQWLPFSNALRWNNVSLIQALTSALSPNFPLSGSVSLEPHPNPSTAGVDLDPHSSLSHHKTSFHENDSRFACTYSQPLRTQTPFLHWCVRTLAHLAPFEGPPLDGGVICRARQADSLETRRTVGSFPRPSLGAPELLLVVLAAAAVVLVVVVATATPLPAKRGEMQSSQVTNDLCRFGELAAG